VNSASCNYLDLKLGATIANDLSLESNVSAQVAIDPIPKRVKKQIASKETNLISPQTVNGTQAMKL
jgi:hypothetical protein